MQVERLEEPREGKDQWGWASWAGLLAQEGWSWVEERHPALSSQPPRDDCYLHGVDRDSKCRVVPIHLGFLGSLRLLGEVLVGDPDPVHAHGHDKH